MLAVRPPLAVGFWPRFSLWITWTLTIRTRVSRVPFFGPLHVSLASRFRSKHVSLASRFRMAVAHSKLV